MGWVRDKNEAKITARRAKQWGQRVSHVWRRRLTSLFFFSSRFLRFKWDGGKYYATWCHLRENMKSEKSQVLLREDGGRVSEAVVWDRERYNREGNYSVVQRVFFCNSNCHKYHGRRQICTTRTRKLEYRFSFIRNQSVMRTYGFIGASQVIRWQKSCDPQYCWDKVHTVDRFRYTHQYCSVREIPYLRIYA